MIIPPLQPMAQVQPHLPLQMKGKNMITIIIIMTKEEIMKINMVGNNSNFMMKKEIGRKIKMIIACIHI